MENTRILIVEDEIIIALGLKGKVQSMGYDVTSIVNNGEDAIKKAGEESPELILMDIRLKGERDGIETAGIIRSRFGIPIVFITAYLDKEKIERTKITMPFGYLLKPIQDRDLRVTLEMAVYTAKVEAARKADKKALLASEKRYRDLIEIMPIGIFEAEENGILTFANQKALTMFGYVEEDLERGLNILQVIAPEDRERVITNMSEVVSGKRFGGIQYNGLNKSGELFPIIIHSSFLKNDGRRFHLGAVIDISDCRNIEKIQTG